MKALVTGATGFVGGALARRLLGEGFELHLLVREPSRAGELQAAGARIFAGTISDPNQIADAAAGCELLFHCAGESSLRASPRVYGWINVAGTENVIQAARHAGCKRVVYLSCADTTLANRDRLHWKEDRIVTEQPLGQCARSKRLAEELALISGFSSIEITVIRSAWTWGPGDRGMLPELCREAARGGVNLFGNGANLLGTLYIDNLIDALLAASISPAAACNAYYVTDGEFLDANEFVGMLCSSVGLPPPRRGLYPLAYGSAWIRERLRLPGPWTADVARRARSSLFDIGCAIKDLEYEPRVSVAEGMERLAAWAAEIGGPTKIAGMGREPDSIERVEREAREALSRARSPEPDPAD